MRIIEKRNLKIVRLILIVGAMLLFIASSYQATVQQVEPFPLGHVRSIGFRTGDHEVYPDQKVWLTLRGGYATHDNNIIVTSGLNNVPLGTYVYLQGKSLDEEGVKITGWSWKVIGPRATEVKLDDANTQTPRFLATDLGRYEVTIVATKENGTTASSNFTVFASKYVGVEECSICHSGSVMEDKVTPWHETGHGTKFEDSLASYTAGRDYCIGCHTTGYNEMDKAGGFDDAARLVGWSPDKGSIVDWFAAQTMTLDTIMNSPMGKFANVQCESCHGPGQIHEGIKQAMETASIFQPGVCSQCHPQEVQWRFSGHANTGANNMEEAGRADCAACHTGQGFVQAKVRGKTPVFPSAATATTPANMAEPGNQPPIACATCHDPHEFSEPFTGAYGKASLQLRLHGQVTFPIGVTKDAGESAVCVSCHAHRRDAVYKADFQAGKRTRSTHGNTQADMFYGVNASVFKFGDMDYLTSPHDEAVVEGCIQCHMAPNPVMEPGPDGQVGTRDDVKALSAGGHSWRLIGEYKGQSVENVGACTSCHQNLTTINRQSRGDYDGNGSVEGIQDEVVGLLNLLAAQLPKNSEGNVLSYPITADNTTETQRMALWNYWFVVNDGSKGIHNTAFTIQLLQRTYEQLTGKPVPGATIR